MKRFFFTLLLAMVAGLCSAQFNTTLNVDGSGSSSATQVKILSSAVNSTSTTYAVVTDLTVDVINGESYIIDGFLDIDASAGGIKVTLDGTATASVVSLSSIFIGSIFSLAVASALGADVFNTAFARTDYRIIIDGIITASASGTMGIQFAQVDADGGTTTISPGSYIKLTKVN